MTRFDEPLHEPTAEELLADPLSQRAGLELAQWAAEVSERVRVLREEADQLERDQEAAFAATRVLMA